MQTINIDKMYRKIGTSKNGNEYEKVDIYSDGVKYSAFDFDGQTKGWQEGQQINVEVKKNGQYLNIELPKSARRDADNTDKYLAIMGDIKAIKARLDKLEGKDITFSQQEGSMSKKSVDDALSDLPF